MSSTTHIPFLALNLSQTLFSSLYRNLTVSVLMNTSMKECKCMKIRKE
jgi:hypothetical protein